MEKLSEQVVLLKVFFELTSEAGKLDVLVWLDSMHPGELSFREILIAAAKHGHVPILQWCKKNDNLPGELYLRSREHYSIKWATPPWWRVALEQATLSRHTGVLKWMMKEKLFLSSLAIRAALESGNLEIVLWIDQFIDGEEWKCSWEKYFNVAVGKDNIALLEFLKNRDCAWGEEAYYEPGGKGNIEILDWLFTNGYPINARCFEAIVATTGPPESLVWFNETVRPTLSP